MRADRGRRAAKSALATQCSAQNLGTYGRRMTQNPAPLNHAQDDFSAGSSGFAVLMGGFGLRQRQLLVDDDLQLSGVDQTSNFLQPDAVHVAAFEPCRDAVLFSPVPRQAATRC